MTYTDYLKHHGILGMKWGQRNGPPYPLTSSQMNSKERANNMSLATSGQNQNGNNQQKTQDQQPVKKDSRKLVKKRVRDLSDEELKTAIDRAKKEKELDTLNASSISNGKRFVKAMMLIGGTVAISTFVTNIARKWGENSSTEVLKRTKSERMKKLAEEEALARARTSVYGMKTKIDTSTVEGLNQYYTVCRNAINHLMQSQGFDKAFK